MALLEGKVAIVTGAGRGIGRAEAARLAAHGAKVVVNDFGVTVDGSGSDQRPAEEVVAEIKAAGGEATASFDDISTWAGAERLVQQAIESFGGLHIVVNNAGILRDRIIWNMTEEDFDNVIRVHLKGTFCTTRHAVGHWRAQHKAGEEVYGRIINTASAAMLGNPGQANYSASKAGLIALTKTAAREFASRGVCINAVAPGFIRTDMAAGVDPKTLEAAVAKIPFKRMGEPAEIADVVAFLASDLARYITGQVILVDGGMAM